MKTFTIHCRDKPGSADKRQQDLQAHFRHVEQALDDILIAGPIKNDTGKIIGSLLIIKADDEQSARNWIEADPQFRSGYLGKYRDFRIYSRRWGMDWRQDMVVQ